MMLCERLSTPKIYIIETYFKFGQVSLVKDIMYLKRLPIK